MITPELSPEQKVERAKIEELYGGFQEADHYYGHLQTLLRALEYDIQNGSIPKTPEEIRDLERMRSVVMVDLQKLGIPIDLLGYESEDIGPFRDLRE